MTRTTAHRTNIKNKTEVKRYQDILLEIFSVANLENMEPEEIIHHLSKLSYEAVKTHNPSLRSAYKDEWSPETIAHKSYLRAFIEIKSQDASGHPIANTSARISHK